MLAAGRKSADIKHGVNEGTYVGRKNAGRFDFKISNGTKEEHHVVKRVVGKPEWDLRGDCWTVPAGYAHPSCPSCDHVYYESMPRLSVGGASVLGARCKRCERELETL